MKQTIEIEVPDGKKAVWKDGKVVFENIKPQLPKTWEEFCDMKKPDKSEAFVDNCSRCIKLEESVEIREYQEDKNLLPSKKAAEQHLALMQLHQLRDCYRQGWEPDWKDDSFKYTIVREAFNKDKKYSIKHYCSTPYFLSFPIYELTEEFLTNFRGLIEQAGDLI